jgi:hypothetical protein
VIAGAFNVGNIKINMGSAARIAMYRHEKKKKPMVSADIASR